MAVHIDNQLADIIRHAAATTYPHECCGLLTGEYLQDDVIITGVHPSQNVTSGDPARGFEVDPKLRFDLMRLLDSMNDGTEIVGHYHSHPDHPAEPSATDLAMVYETGFIWIICAATKSGSGDLRAFKPKQDRSGFDPLECVFD